VAKVGRVAESEDCIYRQRERKTDFRGMIKLELANFVKIWLNLNLQTGRYFHLSIMWCEMIQEHLLYAVSDISAYQVAKSLHNSPKHEKN